MEDDGAQFAKIMAAEDRMPIDLQVRKLRLDFFMLRVDLIEAQRRAFRILISSAVIFICQVIVLALGLLQLSRDLGWW